MGLNINIINFGAHSHINCLYRAELTSNWCGAKKGMKGWLEWDGREFTFELDNPIPWENGRGAQYRICGYSKKRFKRPQFLLRSKKETSRNLISRLKRLEATNEERVDYFIKNLETLRNLDSRKIVPANYALIKEWVMQCIKENDYSKANQGLENLVVDLNREEDIFTPVILE